MASVPDAYLRDQLLDRRQRLEAVIAGSHEHAQLTELLGEVDSALKRIDSGTYGICEYCHEPIGKESLAADPLLRICLDHLTPDQRRALEQDLDLASRMQRELLPQQNLSHEGWEVYYHYQPAGPVSGDYCDVVSQPTDEGGLFFAIGDVSGKGVAASMLMSHLRAIFRMLIGTGLPLGEQIERANRVFCESTMSTYFATLIWGRAGAGGEIELCNAGHVPPLLVRGGKVTRIEPSGVPLGLFCGTKYAAQKLHVANGESLMLFTDGISEAVGDSGQEYGTDRLSRVVSQNPALPAEAMVRACLSDLSGFLAGALTRDDLSMMAIHRVR